MVYRSQLISFVLGTNWKASAVIKLLMRSGMCQLELYSLRAPTVSMVPYTGSSVLLYCPKEKLAD